MKIFKEVKYKVTGLCRRCFGREVWFH